MGFIQLRHHLASDHGMESIEVFRKHLTNEVQENPSGVHGVC